MSLIKKELTEKSGFEIEFCNIASIDELPESKFYIVPSISGYEVMDVHNNLFG